MNVFSKRCDDNEEDSVICHQFKARFKSEYYNIITSGNKWKAEQYIKQELKADELEWIRSFCIDAKSAARMSKANRVIAEDGFLITMEFAGEFGVKRDGQVAPVNKRFQEFDDTKPKRKDKYNDRQY